MVFKDMKLMLLAKELNKLIIKNISIGKTIQLTIDTEIQKVFKVSIKRRGWLNKCDGYLYR